MEGLKGWLGGGTEVEAKKMFPPARKMQMPSSSEIYVRTCTT